MMDSPRKRKKNIWKTHKIDRLVSSLWHHMYVCVCERWWGVRQRSQCWVCHQKWILIKIYRLFYHIIRVIRRFEDNERQIHKTIISFRFCERSGVFFFFARCVPALSVIFACSHAVTIKFNEPWKTAHNTQGYRFPFFISHFRLVVDIVVVFSWFLLTLDWILGIFSIFFLVLLVRWLYVRIDSSFNENLMICRMRKCSDVRERGTDQKI
jgi:hypothetical protein